LPRQESLARMPPKLYLDARGRVEMRLELLNGPVRLKLAQDLLEPAM
jgi:hypothetical protein